jgi:predicted ATPase
MLTRIAVENYRSLRELVVPLGPLNVVTGANGSGKSSLYRALRLLAETAQGGLIAALAREGGLPSTLWAGPEAGTRGRHAARHPVQGTIRKGSVSLKLGFSSEDFGYAIDLGLPSRIDSAFTLDPEIKRECIWAGPVFRRSSVMVDRRGPALRATDSDGAWQTIPQTLPTYQSMMSEFSDPRSAPEMTLIRERVRSWRFYDHFRSDADAPARQPQIGTHTPVLSDDGADLAAALQTIREIGDARGLAGAIDDAFPGSSVEIAQAEGRFAVHLSQPGLLRPLKAAELSDGTLRYLLLVAALLTPRPPDLLVLNEPETSLHPDLLPALARLIASAARHAQVIVVTHAEALVSALGGAAEIAEIRLEKAAGETLIAGQDALGRLPWSWPER